MSLRTTQTLKFSFFSIWLSLFNFWSSIDIISAPGVSYIKTKRRLLSIDVLQASSLRANWVRLRDRFVLFKNFLIRNNIYSFITKLFLASINSFKQSSRRRQRCWDLSFPPICAMSRSYFINKLLIIKQENLKLKNDFTLVLQSRCSIFSIVSERLRSRMR